MFACPDCRTPLVDLRCPTCNTTYSENGGVPVLISRKAPAETVSTVSSAYEEIYTDRTGVWVDQGRTPEFLRYFAGLVAASRPQSTLEIGCGEGFLLSTVTAERKAAIDVSANALHLAREKTAAQFAVAFAEHLPFASESFDVVYSVGVMEHFVDDHAATSEILRVLRQNGTYLALIHTHMDFGASLRQKTREYVAPNFRPVALLKWLGKKVSRPIKQPIQHHYTVASARECLVSAGFKVNREITLRSEPSAPLIGHHVVIFVATKSAAAKP
jgi:ubiquinone/menaquinone biosynthesis C-methylase UbiE